MSLFLLLYKYLYSNSVIYPMILRNMSRVRHATPGCDSDKKHEFKGWRFSILCNRFFKSFYKIIVISILIFNNYSGFLFAMEQSQDNVEKSTLSPINSALLDIYTGTKEQNNALLKVNGFEGYSIVDALKKIDAESDFESRKKLYKKTFTKFTDISNTPKNELEAQDSSLQQIGYLYINSNFKELPVFINKNYVGTTPLENPFRLEFGLYKIWCIPTLTDTLPKGKTLVHDGNIISFVKIDKNVQSHFIDISTIFK